MNEPTRHNAAPNPEKWIREGNLNLYSGRTWEVAYSVSRVEPEDVPSPVAAALPGISWLVEFNLSPTSAKSGEAFLRKAVKALSRVSHGVVEDPQEERLTLPSGVRRFMVPEPSELIDVIEMSWWTNTDALRDPQTLDRLVNVLRDVLPEALPRRYGDYEPPQFKFAESGESHFRAFLKNSQNNVCAVMYPTRPVVDVSISNSVPSGPSRSGYRANQFSIEVEAAALRQPGWQKQLRRFWECVSLTVNPFYGDVRILSGQELSRGLLWSGPQTEEHPVANWWWNGVPNSSSLAIVLGEPYRSLWHLTGPIAEHGGLLFVSVDDWSGPTLLRTLIGEPPSDIAQPPKKISGSKGWDRNDGYATCFPFEIDLSN